MAFTTAAGTNNKCYLKNKDHGAESANAIAISVRMSCYEGNITLFPSSHTFTMYDLLPHCLKWYLKYFNPQLTHAARSHLCVPELFQV